ncbi:GDP-mannose 4,6-dehydratase, partial [bacterium]|nr:GDP-mannose 4,6-dehydratase [bacterium]
LQQDHPDDYVVATNETHTVREFLQLAFEHVGISDWEKHFCHNAAFDRPAEVDLLIGDYSKAKKVLHWQPTVTFEQLVKIMVEAEMAILQGQAQMSDF